jgi:hypothetical protein
VVGILVRPAIEFQEEMAEKSILPLDHMFATCAIRGRLRISALGVERARLALAVRTLLALAVARKNGSVWISP